MKHFLFVDTNGKLIEVSHFYFMLAVESFLKKYNNREIEEIKEINEQKSIRDQLYYFNIVDIYEIQKNYSLTHCWNINNERNTSLKCDDSVNQFEKNFNKITKTWEELLKCK